MTPLDYRLSFIWKYEDGEGNVREYEDTRTGDTFTSEESMRAHCKTEAEVFDSEVQSTLLIMTKSCCLMVG